MHLVERRVGKERVAECLDGLSKSEFYIRAAQRPQVIKIQPIIILLPIGYVISNIKITEQHLI